MNSADAKAMPQEAQWRRFLEKEVARANDEVRVPPPTP